MPTEQPYLRKVWGASSPPDALHKGLVPADDLFGRVSYREKGSAASNEDGNGADEADDKHLKIEDIITCFH